MIISNHFKLILILMRLKVVISEQVMLGSHCTILKVGLLPFLHYTTGVSSSCCCLLSTWQIGDRGSHITQLFNRKNHCQLCLFYKLRFTIKHMQELICEILGVFDLCVFQSIWSHRLSVALVVLWCHIQIFSMPNISRASVTCRRLSQIPSLIIHTTQHRFCLWFRPYIFATQFS